MSENSDTARLGLEVALLYRDLKRALDTTTPHAAQSGLAMTLLLTAESLGHRGPAAASWIDATATRAKSALNLGEGQ